MIKGIACYFYNIKNPVIEFGMYGKPFVQNDSFYYFNVSHSKDHVVLAADKYPVGIDIEFIKMIDLDYFGSILSNEEYHFINESNDSIEEFFRIWTVKEAFFKAVGKGIYMINDVYKIDYKNGMIYIDTKKFHFCTYNYNRYKISICSQMMIDILNVKYVNSVGLEQYLESYVCNIEKGEL